MTAAIIILLSLLLVVLLRLRAWQNYWKRYDEDRGLR